MARRWWPKLPSMARSTSSKWTAKQPPDRAGPALPAARSGGVSPHGVEREKGLIRVMARGGRESPAAAKVPTPGAPMTHEHATPGPQGRPTPEHPATGFLIDPPARRIAPWLYNGDWQTIAPAIRIGPSPFAIVEIGNGDVLYVDDEGLLKPLDWFFAIKGGHQPFAGCGLVLGSNADGEAVSARIAVEDLSSSTRGRLHLAHGLGDARSTLNETCGPNQGQLVVHLIAFLRSNASNRSTVFGEANS